MVNHIFKLVLTALLLWLTVLAAQMGYANLHFFSANNQVDRWEKKAEITSQNSYNRALQSIKLSNQLHPNNPKYIETLGIIQEWAVYGEYADNTNFSLALSSYQKSAQLRPLWPWSWSAKAMTKWRLKEIDDELWHALEMLSKTGPYTKDSNLVLLPLSPSDRALLSSVP